MLYRISKIINSSSSIRSFSLESIIKSKPGEQVVPVYQTKNKFYALFETSFVVLPDGKTIIGVKGYTQNTLITEDITTNKAVSFGRHKGTIQTLLYEKVTQSLLAGDNRSCIKQYRRGNSNNHFILVKDYGDVGIDRVMCSAQVGRLAFFGASNYSIVVIDVIDRRLCEKKNN